MNNKFYNLPVLHYDLDALEPVLSRQQTDVHYNKHHRVYIEKSNELLKKVDDSRADGDEIDVGVVAKKLSFNIGGSVLHNLFWENLIPISQFEKPKNKIIDMLDSEFGDLERFISEFTECATTIEGSGWAILTYDVLTRRLLIFQIGNHNLNLSPEQKILLVLDMWEHAYYIDYKNDKKSYANNFWQVVNWPKVNERLEQY